MTRFQGERRNGAGDLIIVIAAVSGLLIAGFFSTNANADVLSALESRLQALDAGTSVSGTLVVQSNKMDHKDKDKDKGKGSKPQPPAKLQMQINTGDGLGIHLDRALLQAVDAEQQAHADDPEKPTPVTDLLRSVGPIEIERMVSAAPGLLRTLHGASSPVTKPTTYDGNAAQELTVNVPLQASKKDKSNISDYKGVMSVWLDAQGMPLAYRQTFHAKFCKFFLCVSVDETRNGTLQNVGGRLIAISYGDEIKQSGLGQDADTLTTYTFNPAAASATAASK
jgi:hypothetical protein